MDSRNKNRTIEMLIENYKNIYCFNHSVYNYEIFNHLYDTFNNELAKLEGKYKENSELISSLLFNIIDSMNTIYIKNCLANNLKIYSQIESPNESLKTRNSNTLNFVPVDIIDIILNKDISLTPFRIYQSRNYLSTSIALLLFFMMNDCTINFSDKKSEFIKLETDIHPYYRGRSRRKQDAIHNNLISETYNVNILVINDDKTILHNIITKDNTKYIVIFSNYYSGKQLYEPIVFNNHVDKTVYCHIDKDIYPTVFDKLLHLQTADKADPLLPLSEVVALAVSDPKKSEVTDLKKISLEKTPLPKLIHDGKKKIVKKTKIITTKEVYINPLDNGEDLPIIELNINGENKRFLLGKTNNLYSMNTPSSLVGKIKFKDMEHNTANIYLC